MRFAPLMLSMVLGMVASISVSSVASAAIKTEVVEYKEGDTVLSGYLAYDDALKGPRPGVLIAHAWMGQGEYEQGRARQLAGMGYVAFALDIYGKGANPKDFSEAGALSGKYKGDRALLRRRVNAGFETLKKNARVDAKKLAAIGYCFGGTTVLELARSGTELAGVVSFHGGLDTPTPADAQNIKTKVLVLHGGDDPYVKDPELLAFINEMRGPKVDWQLVAYGNALHAFTDKRYTDKSFGAAYDEKAEKRSWVHMTAFFKEIFGE